jgi:DNA-binding response OmpR family regulator
VDYLTKPIDPWVLRAKVAVLVELWEKNRKVRDQAALTATYERRLTQAATRVEQALRLAGTNHELKVMLEQLAEDLQ